MSFPVINNTRSISVMREIQVPDFTEVVSFLNNHYNDLDSREDIVMGLIDEKVEGKLNEIREYITGVFKPFFSLSDEILKSVFFTLRAHDISGNYRDEEENCVYKIIITGNIGFHRQTEEAFFQVQLGINNYTCVTFTVYRNHTEIKELTPQAIREDACFFKGWKRYKYLITEELQAYLKDYYEVTKKKADDADAMNAFLDNLII